VPARAATWNPFRGWPFCAGGASRLASRLRRHATVVAGLMGGCGGAFSGALTVTARIAR
jgi:hypothetical protein